MPEKCSSTKPHDELAAALKGYRLPADYGLAVYSRQQLAAASSLDDRQLCEAVGHSPLCNGECSATLRESLLFAFERDRPTVFRCASGEFGFSIPLRPPLDASCCLVVSGVREQTLDLPILETLADIAKIDPFTLLEELESLRLSRGEDVTEAVHTVPPLPPSLSGKEPHSLFIEKTMERLSAIVGVSTDIDQAETVTEAVTLLSESLGILFNLPEIAVALEERDSSSYSLRGTWGLPEELGNLAASRVRELFSSDPGGKIFLPEETCEELFPNIKPPGAICIPLTAAGGLFGMVALFDTEMSPRDALLAELLTGRVAVKLAGLKREEQYQRESSLCGRLLEMISALALTEGKDDLFSSILKMSSDLVHASCGSLMLIDGEREDLHIVSTIGMNLRLAKSLTVKVGEGIAGKVASSGHPLLVNDIEKDARLESQNRPRFKTKSFVSLPLKFREETIGVLNLSDKKNQEIFTDADLNILTAFVSHASAMIQRSRSLEKAELFERLAVTDPLTELYNRRFLEKRMEEELNRSQRHGLHLTVLLIDLDKFKIYNDLCGHVAGDKALKKVARILKSSVREMDVVTRYGGEEFCLVLPGTSKKESLFVAERIRRGIETELFGGEENLPMGRLTASIGVSSFPEDGRNASALIRGADVALYQAKNDGRNRIALCTAGAASDATGPFIPLPQRMP